MDHKGKKRGRWGWVVDSEDWTVNKIEDHIKMVHDIVLLKTSQSKSLKSLLSLMGSKLVRNHNKGIKKKNIQFNYENLLRI